MNYQLLLYLTFALSFSDNYLQCTCHDMISISNCHMMDQCKFDDKNNVCYQQLNEGISKNYCQLFKYQYDCSNHFYFEQCQDSYSQCDQQLKYYPCAWINNSCQLFPGCSALIGFNFMECQIQSQYCKSDGKNCINIGECNEYLDEYICQKTQNGKSCYWDQINGCQTVQSCENAPHYLSSHQQCVTVLKFCTVKESGYGCQNLKQECSNYETEIACHFNINQEICLWLNNRCQNIECEKIISYSECLEQSFCQFKSLIGCIYQCEKLFDQQSCTEHKCWWNNINNQCIDYICENSPQNYTTQQECENFKFNCIISPNEKGCITNKECQVINNKEYCNLQLDNKLCYWNEIQNKCLEKTCENAPQEYTTSYECYDYNKECTLSISRKGCEIKQCHNAPLTLITNEECEKYYPNSDCITKYKGGCRINVECSQINYMEDCIKDKYDQECIWNSEVSKCKLKQCNQVPEQYILEKGCNQFMSKCQQNDEQLQCQENICENQKTQTNCIVDYNGQDCIWLNQCIYKVCEYAPQYMKTYQECQSYLPNCTLSNLGFGCMEIPLRCEIIKTQEGCKLRKSIQINNIITTKKCSWNQQLCIDQSCETAPLDFNTNEQCQSYLNECYINNERLGCMSLPSCQERKLFENCQIYGSFDCIWDPQLLKCYQKTCETANIKQSKDEITIFTNLNCSQYQLSQQICQKQEGKGCCILNNTLNGCMNRPKYCSQLLNKDNCKLNATINNDDCIWNKQLNKCEPLLCQKIKLDIYTHKDCQNQSNFKCTVNKNNDGCYQLQNDCQQYQNQQSCIINNKQNQCVWKVNDLNFYYCHDIQCNDLYGIQYINHENCEQFNQNCTVLPIVNNKGCVSKKNNCFDYKDQLQCHSTITNLTKQDNCIWNGNRCWNIEEIDCDQIILKTYTTKNCENISIYCKASIKQDYCIQKVCQDFKTINGQEGGQPIYLFEHCQALKIDCTINKSENGCTDIKQSCQEYKDMEQCNYAMNKSKCSTNGIICYNAQQDCNQFQGNNDNECKSFRQFCTYPLTSTGLQNCQNRKCEDLIGSFLNSQDCQDFNNNCTLSINNNQCITILSKCKKYKINTNCIISQDEGNCIWIKDQCISLEITSADVDYCQYISNPKSFEDCFSISKNCSINRAQNICVQIQQTCSQYGSENCFKTKNEYCALISSESNCQIASQIECESLFFNDTYTHELCNQLNLKCTNQGSNRCQSKSCFNAIVNKYLHIECNQWLDQCTVNQNGDKCITMNSKCEDQQQNDCLTTLIDGECIYNQIKNKCIQKSCYNSDQLNSHQECQKYMFSCTIAPEGGCQTKQNCSSYYTEYQCKINNQNKICFWNPTDQNCVDYECNNIEKTILFNNHYSCYNLNNLILTNIDQKCTVNIDLTGQPIGCMNLTSCQNYKYENQCQISNLGSFCFWNTLNSDSPYCEDRTCKSAPKSIKNNQDCQNYQLNIQTLQNNCVLNINKDDGLIQLSGCKELTDCSEYQFAEQCILDQTFKQCKWYNDKCYIYECNSAPSTIRTTNDCEQFKFDCILSNTGYGCQIKDILCANYNKDQCKMNLHGNQCYWNEINNQCNELTCTNQPLNQNWNCQITSNCINNSQRKCKIKQCSDFIYQTDIECKYAKNMNGKCTTDGNRCILRTECENSLIQDACKINNQEMICIWIDATQFNDAYCITDPCQKASSMYKNEIECKLIHPQCTIRAMGGCKYKTTCQSIETQEACTQSIDGTDCLWKNYQCQEFDCKNQYGLDHFQCKNIKSTCTISQLGQCTKMQSKCELYIQKDSCFETLNGELCLWLQSYSDNEYPQGKCIKYKSCYSIPFKNESDCKDISPFCSSDSISCVPQGQKNICYNIIYLTHKECQKINSFCTSDGIKGCIPLEELCQSFIYEESCVQSINSRCIFDNGVCHDFKCSDIKPSYTHNQCNQKLNDCTSDGFNCIQMQKCSMYFTQESCINGLGNDGFCYWISQETSINGYCKLATCTEINQPNIENCQQISQCIFDGINCINKQSCESYRNNIACVQGNNLSQPCIWSKNMCQTIFNCKEAATQNICNSYQKCIFSGIEGCINKTCESIYSIQKQCSFYSSKLNSITYCRLQNNTCSEITDLSQYNEKDCFLLSNQTWVFQHGKCSPCQKQVFSIQDDDIQINIDSSLVSSTGFNLVVIILAVILPCCCCWCCAAFFAFDVRQYFL